MSDLKPKRKSRKWQPDILAVKRFVRAIEDPRVHEDARRAAIYYLADRCLGVKLWGMR